MTKQDAAFQTIYAAAHEAGMAAGAGLKPNPMTVYEANLDGSAVQGGKSWHVPEGVCGFAWVTFAGNTAFGRWTKKVSKASPAYGGWFQVWVSFFNQSYERKMAYATAFAAVLKENGIKAYADGRLD